MEVPHGFGHGPNGPFTPPSTPPRGVVLLTDGDALSTRTETFLDRWSDADGTAIVGANGYETAVAVGRASFPSRLASADLASGKAFAEELSGRRTRRAHGRPAPAHAPDVAPDVGGRSAPEYLDEELTVLGGPTAVSEGLDLSF